MVDNKENNMHCTAGCPTQNHPSYSACLKGKGVRVGWSNSAAGMDLSREKAWDKELDAYADAKRQGIQPEGTSMGKIREATELSNTVGMAYRADTNTFA